MNTSKEKWTAKATYEFGINEPWIIIYDKYGRVALGTCTSLFKHMKENPKDFKYSTFEMIMPAICMALGVMLLSYILTTALIS